MKLNFRLFLIFLTFAWIPQVSFSENLVPPKTTGFDLVPMSTLESFVQINALEDQIRGVPSEHQTKFYLVKNEGQAIKTKVAVVIFHGLYNSPAFTDWLAKKIHALGLNVINARQPEHYHERLSDLDNLSVKSLIAKARNTTTLAKTLGEKVFFIGHSLGGISSLFAAMENPLDTAGLALYAPAIDLSFRSKFSAHLTHAIPGLVNKYAPDTRYGRYISPHAGIIIKRFSNLLKYGDATDANIHSHQGSYEPLFQKMENFETLWFETKSDTTTDEVFSKQLVEMGIEKYNAPITYYEVPAEAQLLHVEMLSDPAKPESFLSDSAQPEAEVMQDMLFDKLKSFL